MPYPANMVSYRRFLLIVFLVSSLLFSNSAAQINAPLPDPGQCQKVFEKVVTYSDRLRYTAPSDGYLWFGESDDNWRVAINRHEGDTFVLAYCDWSLLPARCGRAENDNAIICNRDGTRVHHLFCKDRTVLDKRIWLEQGDILNAYAYDEESCMSPGQGNLCERPSQLAHIQLEYYSCQQDAPGGAPMQPMGQGGGEQCTVVEEKTAGNGWSYTMQKDGKLWFGSSDDDWTMLLTRHEGDRSEFALANCDEPCEAACGRCQSDNDVIICDREGKFLHDVDNCKDGKTIINKETQLKKGDIVKLVAWNNGWVQVKVSECKQDADNDGFFSVESGGDDCDDNDPSTNPGASEVCDGKDNNCNGQIDDGVGDRYYADADGDGYGNPDAPAQLCRPEPGYVLDNTDCNDEDAAISDCAEQSPELCAQANGTWIGTLSNGACCGNVRQEYFTKWEAGMISPFADFPTGCWNSNPVVDDNTAAVSLVSELESLWENTQNALIKNVADEAPHEEVLLVTIDQAVDQPAMAKQEIPEAYQNSWYVLAMEAKALWETNLRIDNVQSTDNGKTNYTDYLIRIPTPAGEPSWQNYRARFKTGEMESLFLQFHVDTNKFRGGGRFDTIYLYHEPSAQVLLSEGTYYGCPVEEKHDPFIRNLQNTETGSRLITDYVDYCTAIGTSYCSYADTWKRSVAGLKNNATKEAPPGILLGNGTIQKECCPYNYCWTGQECVSGIDVEDNPKAIPYLFHGEEYLCVGGEWQASKVKWNWDYTDSGYCPESKCYISSPRHDPGCVEDSFYAEDNYCQNGKWTSRTKGLALTMLDMAGENDYTLFCDNVFHSIYRYNTTEGLPPGKIALNYVLGDVQGQLLPPFPSGPLTVGEFICGELEPGESCANNFCVVRWSIGNEEKVAFGISLNMPIDESFSSSFLNLLPEARQSASSGYYDYCDGAKEDSKETLTFFGCNGKTSSIQGSTAKVWYNDKIQSLIYSQQGVVVGKPNLGQAFLNFLKHPFASVLNFFQSLFSSDPNVAELDNKISDFNTLYLGKTGDRRIRAVSEQVNESVYTSVNYYNYRTNVCKALEEFCKENVNLDRNCFEGLMECQPTILDGQAVFSLGAINNDAFWQGVTAMVRTKEQAAGGVALEFTPQIIALDSNLRPLQRNLLPREPFYLRLANADTLDRNQVVGLSWDFGDGNVVGKQAPEDVSHRYTTADTYNAKLTILDNNFNALSSNVITIAVALPCNPGDVNDDNGADCLDAACVKQKVEGQPVDFSCTYVELCGDIAPAEPDGAVNREDLAAIMELAQQNDCRGCFNGILDVFEEGMDCGGFCDRVCPTCTDGIKNAGHPLYETDIDCGGNCQTKCTEGKQCTTNSDCISGLACRGGICMP